MIEYLKGVITELNPAYAVIENGGRGLFINISLHTYSSLSEGRDVTIYIHEVIREDARQLYGFAGREERELFRLLISVNGVGPNSARMMLSSLKPPEVIEAINSSDVQVIKSVKGIGQKTAERVIVDLRDKVGRAAAGTDFLVQQDNTAREEALSALTMLGFVRGSSTKVVDKLLSGNRDMTVEELIKQALKNL